MTFFSKPFISAANTIPAFSLVFFFFAVLGNAFFSRAPVFAFHPQGEGETQGVLWETDFKKAMQLAAETDRLVLIHFYGDNCPPCRKMDTGIFPLKEVVDAITPHYVALKVDYYANPNAVKNLNITSIPTDLIATPQREIIYRRQGAPSPKRYVEELRHVARKYRENLAETLRETSRAMPEHLPVDAPETVAPSEERTEDSGIFVPTDPIPFADGATSEAGANAAAVSEGFALENVVESEHTAIPGEPDLAEPASESLLGLALPARAQSETPTEQGTPYILDGFCPVALQDDERWVSGDEEFTLRYRNQFFLFSGTDALLKFAKNPEAYTPVAMGEDIVQMAKSGARLRGLRTFGAWYQGKIYLFSSQENYDAFAERPSYYASIATKLDTALIGTQADEKSKTMR